MAQEIKNIKAGQKFLIIDIDSIGFEKDCIVESTNTILNVKENSWIDKMKWVGGYDSRYKDLLLCQQVQDLKRFKGKIK